MSPKEKCILFDNELRPWSLTNLKIFKDNYLFIKILETRHVDE